MNNIANEKAKFSIYLFSVGTSNQQLSHSATLLSQSNTLQLCRSAPLLFNFHNFKALSTCYFPKLRSKYLEIRDAFKKNCSEGEIGPLSFIHLP